MCRGEGRSRSESSLLIPTHLIGELRQALADDLAATSQTVSVLLTETDRNPRDAAYQTAAERFSTRHELQTFQVGWPDDAPATKPLATRRRARPRARAALPARKTDRTARDRRIQKAPRPAAHRAQLEHAAAVRVPRRPATTAGVRRARAMTSNTQLQAPFRSCRNLAVE